MTERKARSVIKASELHRLPGEVIKRVALGNEELIVERDGYPVMVLIPYQAYQRITRDRLQAMTDEATRQGLTEENFTTDPTWQQMKREESAALHGDIESKKKPRKPRAKKA
jgi:prevent-host-death family protein